MTPSVQCYVVILNLIRPKFFLLGMILYVPRSANSIVICPAHWLITVNLNIAENTREKAFFPTFDYFFKFIVNQMINYFSSWLQ